MGKFEVIECIIKDNRYTLIYKVDECKFRYDSFEDDLTKEEYIKKVKQWHDLKEQNT